MKNIHSALLAALISSVLLSPMAYANPEDKAYKVAQKAQMKAEKKQDKYYREMEREQVKHRFEMERERNKN